MILKIILGMFWLAYKLDKRCVGINIVVDNQVYYFSFFVFPAGRETIISQFRVWPFPSSIIMTVGERNRNPSHHFAGDNIIEFIYLNNLRI